MKKLDSGETAPLRLKLRMLEAERERLLADMDYLRDRLAELEDEVCSLRRRIEAAGGKSQIQRVK